MGTGIVFVVLVAIWVAYFVQYWSRRREHLATARSVEAFSEAMRVLERRPVLPATTGDRVSTAYAVSPARVVPARPAPRPQVIAKPHAPTKPSPSRGGVSRMSIPQSPSGAARRAEPRPRRGADRRPQSRPAATSPSRRVRGLTLLGSLAATVVLAVLAAFSVVLPWVPLVGLAAVVGAFAWVRAGVRAEQTARRARRARQRSRQAGPRSRQAGSRSRAPQAARGDLAAPDRAESSAIAAASEVDLAATGDADPAAPAEDPEQPQARPDGWRPVPVPPPTYTLKAKAEHPTGTFGDGAETDRAAIDAAGGDGAGTDTAGSHTGGSDTGGSDTAGSETAGADATATASMAEPPAGATRTDLDGGLTEHRTAAYGT